MAGWVGVGVCVGRRVGSGVAVAGMVAVGCSVENEPGEGFSTCAVGLGNRSGFGRSTAGVHAHRHMTARNRDGISFDGIGTMDAQV